MLKENKWYLKAWCKERQDFRTFKVSRMRDLCLTHECFEPREFESGLTDFKEWKSERIICVDLEINETLRERALDYFG